MKSSKVLGAVLGLSVLLGSAAMVFASGVAGDTQVTILDSNGVTLDPTYLPTRNETVPALMGGDAFNNPQWIYPDHCLTVGGTPYSDGTNGSLRVDTTCVANDLVLSSLADGPTWVTAINGKVDNATYNSQISSINSSINALGSPFNVSTFMANQASTTLFIATSTFNGFMSGAMVTKLAALATTSPWAMGTSSRSIVTGTGATGFQVSSTRNSTDRYNVTVTTTASIAGNAAGYIALEVAPTNSATANDWVEVGRCGNSQALTLAITLQSVQGTTCQLTADVPLGYYEKLRSVTTTGTVTYTYVSGVETLK